MAIDHVAETVIKSEAPVYIRNMFKRRWFDGHDGEDGVSVLQRVLSIDELRAALLKIGTVGSLLAMMQEKDSNVVYAGVQYLREVIRHDDGKRAASIKEMIPPLLNALRHPRPPLQRSAVAVLRVLFDEENLYLDIFNGLLSMLERREAGPLYGAATALRVLCFNEKVRTDLVTDPSNNFWKLSHDYYNRLELRYDKKGPSFREVYQSVGSLITTVQEGVSNHHTDDNQWLESAPYELQKEHNPVVYCTETLGTFIHSPLSLFKSLCQRATRQGK
ncbi:hypothetical protein SCLCIDRAFT_472028 [Scleroderma citrinum Foug A]|uniref:Uncharacterized protein n=1 Tax=Scleroderma citrinum Foug A TaxID=1036808 RepID=A0A0C3DY67_9AGAM|nr:hypothetical protein SCLCIDRAFT_472028 [Scleroderma citrinum Foug A]